MEERPRGERTFGSVDFLNRKEKFMKTYGSTFPSEYWKETLTRAFDDDWLNKRKWTKTTSDPAPIEFFYEGVKLGWETFAEEEMLEAKRKFLFAHEDALPSSYWKRVLTVVFDEIWVGRRFNYEHDLYTPVDEMLNVRRILLNAGFQTCGLPGCCDPRYKGDK